MAAFGASRPSRKRPDPVGSTSDYGRVAPPAQCREDDRSGHCRHGGLRADQTSQMCARSVGTVEDVSSGEATSNACRSVDGQNLSAFPSRPPLHLHLRCSGWP